MLEEILTLDEVQAYLGIDEIDDSFVERNIKRQIKTADLFLAGAIGKNYPKTDERAKELALMLVSDMYENRTTTEVSSNVSKLFNQMCFQLKMELLREDKK